MKRLIYVPFCTLEDGEIPKIALDLAKETRLSIRVGEEGDNSELDVCVMQVPEINQINFKASVKANFIQTIDYTNEFIIFPRNLKCEVTRNPAFGGTNKIILTPVLIESHIVKYRDRFSEKGIYDFVISTGANGVIFEGKFEVI
jgi:hypothetical protein